MRKIYRFDPRVFAEVYKRKVCNVSATCQIIGINRSLYDHYRRTNKEFDDLLKEQEQAIIDAVETKLLELIQAGNVQAILFFLKTKGRSRGYTENPTTVISVMNNPNQMEPVNAFKAKIQDAETRRNIATRLLMQMEQEAANQPKIINDKATVTRRRKRQ